MTINTERLRIVALNAHQLWLWTEDVKFLEKELNCIYKAEPMEGLFLQIVKEQVEITERDSENYCWHSFFFLIRKSDNTVVGSADFKDVPNDCGEVEIGYGTGKEFENNGYMTEGVKALCDWAKKQDGVLHIIAETETDGLASQHVLKKCGFTEYRRDKTVWWKN